MEEWEKLDVTVPVSLRQQPNNVILRDDGYIIIDFYDETGNKLFQLDMDSTPVIYRVTDIKYREKTIDRLRDTKGKDFLKHIFYYVKDSLFLKDFCDEYLHIFRENELFHCVILSKTKSIDLILFKNSLKYLEKALM